ncbi:MAG: hypothetical protein MUC53_13750, partial [Candidatus Contendobacter sp.]|nr:hypothetical protein [Candidatus Contendobacter sp.]
MTDIAKEILPVNLEDEMRQSYLDYAMSVIVGRALPDVRDGLKPVHRRVLFAMSELGNDWNKPYKKSARVVGDVIGKYHPHGDTAVYDTIVRMAQPFSLRYMLVDGQGNFGCFSGDTQIKLADGSERSFAELAQLPSDEIFYVYAVDDSGSIVIAEGRFSRITRHDAELLEIVFDNGAMVRCTPDHRFMLRDGTYKEAKDLIPEDSLMPGIFDTAPVKEGLNDYLRIFQPNLGEYQFVHYLADQFNARNGLAREFSGPFVRHSNTQRLQENPCMMQEMNDKAVSVLRKNWQKQDYRQQVMRQKIAGYIQGLIKAFPEQTVTPDLYESQRSGNWIPHVWKAVEYFSDFEAMVEAGRHYNHRIVSKRILHQTADVYDITVDEYHNFLLASGVFVHNSVDGDAPAAMRYTEVRMARIAHELLADLDKETVDFVPNYDESEHEPSVFPTRLPNLLINGSSGIAVGMATNIPSHNLGEVVDACIALIDDPALTIADLMRHIPGPDFPTAALINGVQGIRDAYETGRGRIQMRARTEIETDEARNRQAIIVTELPYQVNKARLIEKIAELVKDRKLEGIAELRDESDKDGMRIYIELRRGESADVVLNNLFLHTSLQCVFGVNMVALVDGQPRLLNLKQVLEAFLTHRREVVVRRTVFELRKARERAHIVEGLAVALANLDPLIALIRAAADPAAAKAALLERAWTPGLVTDLLARAGAGSSRPEDLPAEFGLSGAGYRLSPAQAQAILDLRLHRLTGLEQRKLLDEYQELLDRIRDYLEILTLPERLTTVIRAELQELRAQYGDARRTVILPDEQNFNLEDLITEETVVVTLSHAGYVKSQPLSLYRAQRRGGRGRAATTVREEDFVDKLFIASTHDTVLCFSNRGRVYWKKVYELPQAGRTARGKPIVNLLPLEEGERINAVLAVREFGDDHYVFFATASGTVKKTPLSEYSRPRPSGIIAIDLDEGDQLVNVELTHGQRDIMLFTDAGKA